jgi:putative flippase GtrA
MSASRVTSRIEQPTRYLLVGGFNTFFGITLFTLLDLTIAQYVGHYVVLTIASVVTVVAAHATQRRLVWLSSGPYFRELARFSSVYVVAYFVNLALLYVAHERFGSPVIPAQLGITAFLAIGTYITHRIWTFAPRNL